MNTTSASNQSMLDRQTQASQPRTVPTMVKYSTAAVVWVVFSNMGQSLKLARMMGETG